MKRFDLLAALLSATFLLCTAGFAQTKDTSKAASDTSKAASTKPLNVAFVIYNGVELLDLSGPMDVFVKANRIAPDSYNSYTVAVEDGPIATEAGAVKITPRYTIHNNPRPDILIVPGTATQTLNTLYANRDFVQWLKRQCGDSQLVMSVCTGAFLLGKSGVLDGKQATTHWFVLDAFQQEFPQTTAMQGVRFVEDGKFVTTAGISSGIDGALHLVEKTKSKQIADSVASAMQYRRGTPAYPTQTPGKVVLSSPTAAKSNLTGSQKLGSKVDPVCGMAVDTHTNFTYEYHGHRYGFCSEQCRKKFMAHPAEYTK